MEVIIESGKLKRNNNYRYIEIEDKDKNLCLFLSNDLNIGKEKNPFRFRASISIYKEDGEDIYVASPEEEKDDRIFFSGVFQYKSLMKRFEEYFKAKIRWYDECVADTVLERQIPSFCVDKKYSTAKILNGYKPSLNKRYSCLPIEKNAFFAIFEKDGEFVVSTIVNKQDERRVVYYRKNNTISMLVMIEDVLLSLLGKDFSGVKVEKI